ncbi:hypothetical protein H0266_10910 [Halobacillus locisalis]|uniref:Uncharacterized protein n=1 Tax=Halobacillus locisalis TaxID=220753 RepID=A0A838CTY6_9BACI|nr:hypothetical protein [Halobacillus locisalis]MBA2175404.1 hypothetical protein [Halobacillus locisalis]
MIMALKYRSFRGDVYYLQSKKTKKGNTTYFASKKKTGAGADMDELPDGYEIYEDPSGKVFVRRELKVLFHDDEIDT